jgi:hypothetical protein
MNDKEIPFPLPDEDERGEVLASKIVELCHDEESNRVVLGALLDALVYFFSRICPVCQRNISKGIKKLLPDMVRAANELAKDNEGSCH